MEEFNKLIEYCDEQYQNSNACNCGSNCVNNNRCKLLCTSDCYECVSHVNHFCNTIDHYNCHKMTLFYVLKHGFRFYAETALLFIDAFANYASDEVFVMSIGCGPCTELYGGLQAWRYSHKADDNFHYHGFDLNPIWKSIDDFNLSQFENSNVFIEIKDAFVHYKNSDEPIDIIILNYSLSDMFRFNKNKYGQFVNSLLDLLAKKKPQYLLINDVYTKQSVDASTMFINELNDKRLIKNNSMRRFHSYNSYIGEFGNYVSSINGINNFPNIEGIDQNIVNKYDPFHIFNGIQAVIKLKSI